MNGDGKYGDFQLFVIELKNILCCNITVAHLYIRIRTMPTFLFVTVYMENINIVANLVETNPGILASCKPQSQLM